MAWNSIVDYMKASKMNSSFGNRAALAAKYGIKGYKGTANQNVSLLNMLQRSHNKVPAPRPVASHPTVHKPAPTPHISSGDQNFYNSYTKALQSGTADPNEFNRYNSLASQWKLQKGTISNDALQQLSLKALGGDTNAANYLKTMKYNPLTGSALWKGVTNDQLDANHALRSQYWKDNPYADYTKQHDMSDYNRYVGLLNNGQPIDPHQMDVYHHDIQKWNLQDVTDPYYQQQQSLAKDKQSALNAQDVALNQGLGAQDATNFQNMQALQQQMQQRGMGDSGIAQDYYLRASMAANQNYQKAFADAATNKANIANQYDTAIANSKIAKNTSDQAAAQAEQQNLLNQQKLAETAANDQATQQTNQDKYLTSSTGYVYLNGKQLKDSKGHPVTSLDYQKMSETKRHNLAVENETRNKDAQNYALGSQKNANSYNLGMEKDRTARLKISADLQKSISANKLAYAKLDFSYKKLESDNKYRQDLIKKAADAAQNSKDRNQLNALGKQADNLVKQITSIQKKAKPTSADKIALQHLVKQYNSVNNSISSIVGGSSFQNSGGGGDYSYQPPTNNDIHGGGVSLGNTPSHYQSDLQRAQQIVHIPSSQIPAFNWIIQHESSFNPSAKNPHSTAHGYGQFLNSTVKNYERKMGLSYNNGANQLAMAYQYMVDRYGSPQGAMKFWQAHNWY